MLVSLDVKIAFDARLVAKHPKWVESLSLPQKTI
jgi:hypothetical protein